MLVSTILLGVVVAGICSLFTKPVPFHNPQVQKVLDKVDLSSVQPLLNTSITRASLLIAKEVYPDLNVDALEAQVKQMAEELRSNYPELRDGDRDTTIRCINNFLYLDKKIRYDDSRPPKPETYFMFHVLQKKTGCCISMPVMYLAIGEQLGLPLHLVETPDHGFLRWDDGKVRDNIECTTGGGWSSDEDYIRDLVVGLGYSMQTVEEGIYMRSLNHRDMVAELIANRGQYYMETGQREKAGRDWLTALALNPRHPFIHNLAWRFLCSGDIVTADAFAQEVIRLGLRFKQDEFQEVRGKIATEQALGHIEHLDPQRMQKMWRMMEEEERSRRRQTASPAYPPECPSRLGQVDNFQSSQGGVGPGRLSHP